MNKTYLIVGGASAASLAVGAASGFFFAKKKFDATLELLIDMEVAKTKKHFQVQLEQAQAKASALEAQIPEEAAPQRLDEPEEEEEEEELTEADEEAIAKGRKTLSEVATAALVNYQRFADKPDLSEVASGNIFSKDAPKKKLPPRDPTGKFQSKSSKKTPEQTPYLITDEDFLLNDRDYEQKNLLYFRAEATLIDLEDANEAVDIGRVGEVNLTLFPSVEQGQQCSIFVRNEGLAEDYEVRLMEESLTSYMGLGDDEEQPDDNDNEMDPDAEYEFQD